MLKNIFLGLVLIMILVGAGCKKGCSNCDHGTCSGNTCNCPDPYSGNNCDTMCAPGYEGYMCATYSKDKFFGTWNCSSTAPSGNKINFLIVFSDYPSVHEFMYMTNFNNDGSVVPCTLTGKYQFQVQDSTTGAVRAYFEGFANENNGLLTMYITENNVNYFATATKQ